MSKLEYINDEIVKDVLDWDSLVSVIEKSLVDVSKKDESTTVPPRLFMRIPDKQG